MTEEFELVVSDTLQDDRYNFTQDLRYMLPKREEIRAPGRLGGTSVNLDKPINNKIFSLAGKGESGSLNFTAIQKFDADATDADRSNGTLDDLITELEDSTVSGSDDEATKLKNRFGQDSGGTYIVRTIEEQGIWLREFIHNPGLNATWTLFGGRFDFRTIDGSGNNTGTPVFIEEADVEPSPTNKGVGVGSIKFKIGDRL